MILILTKPFLTLYFIAFLSSDNIPLTVVVTIELTLDGRMVRAGSASTEGLPAGLYIAGGKKVIVK